jgi:hypothetical protein
LILCSRGIVEDVKEQRNENIVYEQIMLKGPDETFNPATSHEEAQVAQRKLQSEKEKREILQRKHDIKKIYDNWHRR